MSEVSVGSDSGLVIVKHTPEFESGKVYTGWLCEKWSEEACKFARKKTAAVGDISSAILRKVVGKAELEETHGGNLLVNEGIARLLALLTAAGGTAYNNANAYIGVGDTATAATATDTELNAANSASNRFYKAMNASYPTAAVSQTQSWQSDFATSEANFAWNEWTVAAGATTASGSGFLVGTTNLNHKIASLGTKASGTWTLTAQITIS